MIDNYFFPKPSFGCLMTKGEKIRIKDFKSVLLSMLHRSDRCPAPLTGACWLMRAAL
jgi:hypothetical protein